MELSVGQLPPLDCDVLLAGSHILSSLPNSSLSLYVSRASNIYQAPIMLLELSLGFRG